MIGSRSTTPGESGPDSVGGGWTEGTKGEGGRLDKKYLFGRIKRILHLGLYRKREPKGNENLILDFSTYKEYFGRTRPSPKRGRNSGP